MSELYASIPSPRPPSFPPPSNAGDVEIYRRLETFEDPDGLRTPMYRYQFVCVAPAPLNADVQALRREDAPDGGGSEHAD
jgi:hypothetical protein